MRIMAIDYGKKRVGIAISDSLCVISQPLLTLRAKSQKDLIARLKCIIEENNVGFVIVGNPLSHKGELTEMSQEIHRFLKKFRTSIDIKVKLWDERFTSRYALKIMKDIGLKKQKDKIDQIAASIMLDEYLKSQPARTI
ncbi:Holliday junction resolvase RuvX [candidate division WOR-3 bacterium]|jgi:putative Holliday junction resolvase|nr:Holliday junction resolvase RuvX [candidate division WOR-3 bacterium]